MSGWYLQGYLFSCYATLRFMRLSDREKSLGSDSLAACPRVPHVDMSSAKPLDVAVLSKVQGSGTRDLWKAHQEYGEKTNGSTKEWSSFILAKEGEVSVIRVPLHLRTHASRPSNSRFDARIRRRRFSQLGSPLTPAMFNSIFYVRRVRREIRWYVWGQDPML